MCPQRSDRLTMPSPAVSAVLLFCLVWFMSLKFNLQNILSTIPMLFGKTVARQQNYVSG